MAEEQKNGWNEWSKHIIRELERLNANSEKLREDIQKTNLELTKLKGVEKEISALKQGVNQVKDEIEKNSFRFENRVDDRIKTLIKDIDKNVMDTKYSVKRLTTRITTLEKYRSYVVGIGVAVGVIIAFLMSIAALFDWGAITGD
jgi:predicted RNase H-like nuclease (RuvC/YqgF family)